MTEVFANFAQSTLAAPISASQTTITIATPVVGQEFPATGNFRIVVQSFDPTTLLPVSGRELMLVTAVSGNTFTVTRGAESTTAIAFASGATVSQIVTAQVMRDLQSSGSGITFTDGVHTVSGATQLSVTGGTVGGTSPNATLSITGSGSPGGSNTQIQYNNSGSFGGDTATTDGAGNISLTSVTASGLTASQIVATDASKKLQTLAVATYPSLTELSYVKGVTSAIQTQIDGKQASGSYVLQSTTVNGHALSANVTVTASDVGLGSVTNDAQTKAAIVPNAAPSAGQILVGNGGGTAYAPVSVSGSGATISLSSAGVITISSVANASLSNSAITIAGTSTSLGGSITQDTITGLASTGLVKRTGANTLAIGSAGTDYVAPGGALGTPSSGTLTNCGGTAASLTAGHVSNATFTTALTVNTGTLTLTANAANTSVLTIGAGAVSVSGSNTGDQTITLTGAVTGSGTGSFATTIATPGTLTVSSTNSTATAHTHAITSSSAPGAAASILATNASGIIGSTGTRIVKGWFTDLTVTNAITGSVTGNAATATALQNARTIGGTSFDGTANITVASATGGFAVSGGTLTAAAQTNTGILYLNGGVAESAVFSNGNSGTSKALNLDNGNLQSLTITGAVTITLTTPTHPGKFTVIITQDGTGHVYSISGVKFPGGTAPSYSTAASKIDVISLIYDGTNWYGMGGIAFS